jgi:predicted nucleic acid-binding protein
VIVVSDTSPLIALHAIGRLDLLEALYREVFVPDAVRREYLREDATDPESQERERRWLIERKLPNAQAADILKTQLGAGEAEAIALSLGASADLLLMDERRGRRTAERLGIRCLGTAGVLLQAKQRGLLAALRPELEALTSQAAFWLSEPVQREILAMAGET